MSLREDVYSLFPEARDRGKYLQVKCPFHKGGQERHPSMSIVLEEGYNGLHAGFCRCFTCDWQGMFTAVAEAFGLQYIPDDKVTLDSKPVVAVTRRATLKKDVPYNYSEYLASRGIFDDVQHRFRVYDRPDEHKVYMPVFDRDGRYLYANARATDVKAFFVERGARKTLGCIEELDFAKPIAIVESQINAYTLWQAQYCRACATLGATNMESLQSIKKATGPFLLMFDGDEAGQRATEQAKSILGAYRCIIFNLPPHKDVNDVWKECGFDANKFGEVIDSFRQEK